jgi:magnesium-transporting ATPase (P-type)
MCKEKLEEDAMQRKPIDKHASVFAFGRGVRVAVTAAVFRVIAMIGYYIGRFVLLSNTIAPSHEVGMTMAYVAVGWSSVVNILNVRSFNKSIFTIGLMSNKLLFCGVCFSVALVFVTAFIPGIMDIFYCVPLSLNHWLLLIGLSVSPIVVVELQKLFIRRKIRHSL